MENKITIDGNTATATIAYAMSEVATIYPITPSSPMAEVCDSKSASGEPNIFGTPLKVVEMQSEGGASGALHGCLASGSLATTFTASQGLLLMIPNMYKIAGELLPCVMHVSARSLATHALNIFGDHSDVMAVRQTGWAMLNSTSVQEAMDMALVAHLATLKSSVPFVHFFDGFRTSHEINTISNIDLEKIKTIIPYDNISAFKARALNSTTPHAQGTAQNPDIFFQNREASNKYYDAVPKIVEQTMQDVYDITGRKYHLFDYVGHPKATSVIVLMGSGCSTAEETVKYLNKCGQKVGLIKVRLYRPFSIQHFIKAIPASVKRIAVLDRTKENGAIGEPLYQDVITALSEAKKNIVVIGGRYGLGSKEFTPSMVGAVFENLNAKRPKNHFTIGIDDDVTNTSLKITSTIHPCADQTSGCKFYGYGGDGTVSANKNSIKIISECAGLYGQAYFEYDSKKSGNATISHLRFSKNPINESYLLDDIDVVAVHNQTYVSKYNILRDLKKGGKFLLNTSWKGHTLEKMLPSYIKNTIARDKIELYTIDANALAKELGLGNKINLLMQSAFFKISSIIDFEEAKVAMKKHALKSYGHKGEKVVEANYRAIDMGGDAVCKIDYPMSWANVKDANVAPCSGDCSTCEQKYYHDFISPISRLEGNSLPVSAFSPDGYVPTDTTKWEKRGIATSLPCWNSKECIECNMCAFVCPHSAIRPHLIKSTNLKNAPKSLETIDAVGEPGYKFVMQVNPHDCTGCGVCASVCPKLGKAITMTDASEIKDKLKEEYEYIETKPLLKSTKFSDNTVKGSQFNKPYFEFSGACAGCGETPYIKVLTQLFGDHMVVANATGCSSIYGGSAPTCPYAKDELGHGPAWANSLFEDNAEFGYGIKLGQNIQQDKLKNYLLQYKEYKDKKTNSLIDNYLSETDRTKQREFGDKIVAELQKAKAVTPKGKEIVNSIVALKGFFADQSTWIIGGDGWAYDIGYGGLDHVLASGENVNILVLDTEVYSNTGGQASKSTHMGAVAKFASKGKRTHKKDLALMATTYKDVYVASISMGANMAQVVTAFKEAEAYNGVSLIIAYAPCIEHGINMKDSQNEMKRAVQCGYVNLWRYNPLLLKEGKNPFILDSPQPVLDYNEFIMGENRYSRLVKTDEELAKTLFDEAKKEALERYENLKKLAGK